MNEQLEPCLFCGGEASVRREWVLMPDAGPYAMVERSFVRCMKCLHPLGFKDDEQAIAAWNKRAEHPADDAEPVTEEWLRSVGFTDKGTWWQIKFGRIELYCYRTRVDGLWVFKLEDAGDDDEEELGGVVRPPPMPTRGHVRRLCNALGIPLGIPLVAKEK